MRDRGPLLSDLQLIPSPPPERARRRPLLALNRVALVAKTPLLVALGLYLSGGRFHISTAGAAIALASALWASLYALNDAADALLERGAGLNPPAWGALAALPLAICLIAFPIAPRLSACFALMTAGQAAYCLPPLRMKKEVWAIHLLGGFLNPFLRLQCGAMWGSRPVLPAAYGVVFALHVGAAIRSRALSRERDRRLGYAVAPEGSERLGKACTAAGLAGGYALCAAGTLPPLFWALATAGSFYAAFAWSGAITRRSQLRRDAAAFIVFSLLATAVLLMA